MLAKGPNTEKQETIGCFAKSDSSKGIQRAREQNPATEVKTALNKHYENREKLRSFSVTVTQNVLLVIPFVCSGSHKAFTTMIQTAKALI